jgi:hypothetical protein
MCLLEKSPDSTAFDAEQSVLYGPVCLGIIAKYGHYSRISAQSEGELFCSQDCVAEGERFEPSVRFESV